MNVKKNCNLLAKGKWMAKIEIGVHALSVFILTITFTIKTVVSDANDTCLAPNEGAMISSMKTYIQQLSSQISGLEASLSGKVIEKFPDGCEKGWVQYRNHCYFISSDRQNWFSAERYCREHGSSLVKIEDAEENAWLFTKSPNEIKALWIGGSDMKEGQWLWNVDFKPFSYANWNSGEPNGGTNENCLNFLGQNFRGTWNDYECEKELQFACKRKMKCDCNSMKKN